MQLCNHAKVLISNLNTCFLEFQETPKMLLKSWKKEKVLVARPQNRKIIQSNEIILSEFSRMPKNGLKNT
ncbi:hypothetical protein C2G38_2118964 [Gigaspora rosea]|uniref:Uncharacterized protein n=1 Tax=Gigaspora rosea TaxID=44941 RepID=A0A397UDJ0_9GLOM|nr:hypothetical protein C2G38_2118964 [Gigaspora rosea]